MVRKRRQIHGPPPPDHLGAEAQDEWRRITAELPHDWLAVGALPLLESLCALTVSARVVQQEIGRVEREPELNHAAWSVLVRQHGELSGRISTLATRLRLTPQSRYGPRSAAPVAASVVPWRGHLNDDDESLLTG